MAGQGESGETPVCFRYRISPVASHTTNVFKPTREVGEGGDVEMRPALLGGCFVGHMDKIINNKRAGVIWEASFIFR